MKPQRPMSTYYVDHALYARRLAEAGYFDDAYDALSVAFDLTEEGDDEAVGFIDASHGYIKSLDWYARNVA